METREVISLFSIEKQLKEIDSMKKELLRIMDKGGVTIVFNNDILITAYNTDSYKRY